MNERHPETERPLRPVRDLAGIRVRDASGVTIGSIWGALADAYTGLIRYVDVALEAPPRHVLVPIGHARLRATAPESVNGGVTRPGALSDAHELRLRAALLEELTAIPAYAPAGSIDDSYEHALLHAHGQLFHGERYYAHPAFDHRGFYAGTHPIARDPGQPGDSGLQPLRSLRGYRLAREEPDVRGWPLAGEQGEQLGVVSDLVVDVDAGTVRYAAIERAGRRVLLPVGFLDIDVEAARVVAPGLRDADLAALPAWDGSSVERWFEDEVRSTIEASFRGERRYVLPDFRFADAPDGIGREVARG